MKYIQLALTTFIAIALFVIINNQNEQRDYRRASLIKLQNIDDEISIYNEKQARNKLDDSLKVKLLETLQDLEVVE